MGSQHQVADLLLHNDPRPTMQTLAYRCPEVLGRASVLTTAIDMWSLGVVMSEVLECWGHFRGVKMRMNFHRNGIPF